MADEKGTTPNALPIQPRGSISETLSRADRVEKMPHHMREEYERVIKDYGSEAGVRFLEKWEKEVADHEAQREAQRKETERVQALSDAELANELKAIRTSFISKVRQLKSRGLNAELFLTDDSGSIVKDGSNKGQSFGMRVYRNIE